MKTLRSAKNTHLFLVCLLSTTSAFLHAIDANFDGMDDSWQQRYTVPAFAGALDYDNDGRINLVESINASDPRAVNSGLGSVYIHDTNPQDGMDDIWQTIHGILSSEKLADPDADGRKNIEESIVGSDPHKADKPWSSESSTPTTGPGSFTVTLSRTTPGLRYQLQTSDDLVAWQNVTDLINPFWGSGTESQQTLVTGSATRKFARFILDNPDTDNDALTDWLELTLGTQINIGDTDGDGIPDGWEYQNALSPITSNTGVDADLDGRTDVLEYSEGTSPTQWNSPDYRVLPGHVILKSNLGEVPVSWLEIQPQGTKLTFSNNDDGEVRVPLPFPILRRGAPYDSVRISTNGVIGFLTPGYLGDGNDSMVSSTRVPQIAAFWDDLKVSTHPDSGVYVSGDTTQFTIQYHHWRRYSEASSDLNFQIVLHRNGLIELNYNGMTGSLNSATIGVGGLEDIDYNQNYLASALDGTGRCSFHIYAVDLDSDSDNTNGVNPPARSRTEDIYDDLAIGDTPSGKMVVVSTGDFDDDNIPDFADGFDVVEPGQSNQCAPFVPVVIDVSALSLVSTANIRFNYLASSPADVQSQTVTNDYPVWTQGTGDFRLWTKNGNLARAKAPVTTGGDYVPAALSIPIASLNPDSNGVITLYVEALKVSAAAGDKILTFDINSNNQAWKYAGKIRFTTVASCYFASPGDLLQPLPNGTIYPYFGDGQTALYSGFGGTLINTNSTLQVGLNQPHPLSGQDEKKDKFYYSLRNGAGPYFPSFSEYRPLIIATAYVPPSSPPAFGGAALSAYTEEEDQWEADFEAALMEKYEEANPRIEDMERDAFELMGWLYGGRRSEWFSTRSVWRDNNRVYVEDSLEAVAAADAYYAFLKRALEPTGPSMVPILKHYREAYTAVDVEERGYVGQQMAKHWDVVELTAGMMESEYIFVPASFAIGSALQIRQLNNMTFYTQGKTFAIPLIRRNWARGSITEHDTLVESLGFARNVGTGRLKLTGNVAGELVDCIPDAVRPHWFIEVKDWKTLSATKQIRAEFDAAYQATKRVCLITTTRTRTISSNLHQLIQNQSGILLRRNLNTDAYEIYDYAAQTPGWVSIDKAAVSQLLSTP